MADDDDLSRPGLRGDEKILDEAKRRFRKVKAWESDTQARMISDLKFANADPDNGWQWPNYLWSQRRDDPSGYKPKLTINEINVRNKQIINDGKQNKPGVHIRPVGGDATFKAAQIWEQLVKHIERVSNAEQAYDTASTFQVDGGIGYIRLKTEYVDDNSFDQELKIERIKNPLLVYMDMDANEVDKSDSNYAFVFEDVDRAEFLAQNPEMRGKLAGQSVSGDFEQTWLSGEKVRTAEYFRRKLVKDRLVLMRNPDPDKPRSEWDEIIARWSRVPKAVKDLIDKDTIIKEREIIDHEIEWFKIAGHTIMDRGIWPGRFIPIVPVIGTEVVIEGQLDRKGHTRAMKDAQRMYNFAASSAVEYVALGTKARWFVPVGATENLETYFSTLNTNNWAFIPYNAVNENGEPLPAPSPIEPPQMAEGYVKVLMISRDQLMMSSGQYQAQLGQNENAKSGVAIAERQRQGDNVTYHFIDGLAIAIRQVGNIILDAAPHIYDTKQIKRIAAEDGTEMMLHLDPNAEQAYAEERISDTEIKVTFNPNVGRYWVASDVGPSYATKRQEAWNAFVQITSQNRELVMVIGDLMFRNADFPGALEIAQRLKRLVPQQALPQGPNPDLLAAQDQLKSLQQLLSDSLEEIGKYKLQLADKAEENKIRQQEADTHKYEAETKRLKEAGNAESDLDNTAPGAVQEVVAQMLKDMGLPVPQMPQGGAQGVGQASGPGSEDLAAAPDLNAGKEGTDGEIYIPDPARPGQHLRLQKGNGSSADLVPVEGAPVQ